MDFNKLLRNPFVVGGILLVLFWPALLMGASMGLDLIPAAGGKGIWFTVHALGFAGLWTLFFYGFIKRIGIHGAMSSESGRYSIAKWFRVSWRVISVMVVGFLIDYVLSTVLFANPLSICLAMGVIVFLFRRPEGGIPQVDEGPVQADAMRSDDFRLETRPGMDKYAGEAVRPPVITPAAPRPPTATRPPTKDDQELS